MTPKAPCSDSDWNVKCNAARLVCVQALAARADGGLSGGGAFFQHMGRVQKALEHTPSMDEVAPWLVRAGTRVQGEATA